MCLKRPIIGIKANHRLVLIVINVWIREPIWFEQILLSGSRINVCPLLRILYSTDLKSIVSLPKDILLKLHITETLPMPVNDLKSVRYARWLVFLLINIPSRYTHVKESLVNTRRVTSVGKNRPLFPIGNWFSFIIKER